MNTSSVATNKRMRPVDWTNPTLSPMRPTTENVNALMKVEIACFEVESATTMEKARGVLADTAAT